MRGAEASCWPVASRKKKVASPPARPVSQTSAMPAGPALIPQSPQSTNGAVVVGVNVPAGPLVKTVTVASPLNVTISGSPSPVKSPTWVSTTPPAKGTAGSNVGVFDGGPLADALRPTTIAEAPTMAVATSAASARIAGVRVD